MPITNIICQLYLKKEAAAVEEKGEEWEGKRERKGEESMDVHLNQAWPTSFSGDRLYFRLI